MNDNSVRRSGFRNSRRTHNGHTKGKCLRRQYRREPERLKRVPFVRLQQRNASGIASRSTVAADKSRFRVLTSRKAKRQRKLVTSPVCDSYNQRVFLEMVTVSRIVAAPLDFGGVRNIGPGVLAAGARSGIRNHRTAATTVLSFCIVFAAISRSAGERPTSLPRSLPVIHTCERKYVLS